MQINILGKDLGIADAYDEVDWAVQFINVKLNELGAKFLGITLKETQTVEYVFFEISFDTGTVSVTENNISTKVSTLDWSVFNK